MGECGTGPGRLCSPVSDSFRAHRNANGTIINPINMYNDNMYVYVMFSCMAE